MLVDHSLDHFQVTTGTLKGERSIFSLIRFNCIDTSKLFIHGHKHAIIVQCIYIYTHILGHTDVLEQDI